MLILLLLFFSGSGLKAQVIPDNYTIPTSVFRQHKDTWLTIDSMATGDCQWFRNDSLQQTLIVEFATDYWHLYVYHFSNNYIPSGFTYQLPIYKSEAHNTYKIADDKLKKDYAHQFMDSAYYLPANYFKSNKGARPGISSKQLQDIYGPAQRTKQEGADEIWHWEYKGELEDDATAERMKEVANAWGYAVTAWLHNDIVVALVIYNGIP
ncbi:MAG: hypothetical protein U0V74_00605 [Chitinophagales bacterium]